VHDTNYVLVEQTVNYNVLGHSVYLEDGISFHHMLVVTRRYRYRNWKSIHQQSCYHFKVNRFLRTVLTVNRPVPGGNEVGYFNDPKCATNPPGLRLQFLDDL
jgi:hypothetical protein